MSHARLTYGTGSAQSQNDLFYKYFELHYFVQMLLEMLLGIIERIVVLVIRFFEKVRRKEAVEDRLPLEGNKILLCVPLIFLHADTGQIFMLSQSLEVKVV